MVDGVWETKGMRARGGIGVIIYSDKQKVDCTSRLTARSTLVIELMAMMQALKTIYEKDWAVVKALPLLILPQKIYT